MKQACTESGQCTQEKTPSMHQGAIELRTVSGTPELSYYLYIPESFSIHSPLFISVHGISRNAREHAELFSAYAEQHSMILVAPVFAKKTFCDYQRLGQRKKCARSDLALNAVIDEVRARTGTEMEQVYLFGFSGGAQFVHRYIMAYPHRVIRAAAASAGWYTFPDPTVDYPLGTKITSGLDGISIEAPRFLSVPVSVFVGEQDTEQDDDLRKSAYLFHQQGLTRIERGKRWTKVMNAAARTYNLKTRYDFRTLPRSGHSFTECMEKGEMARHIFDFFRPSGLSGKYEQSTALERS